MVKTAVRNTPPKTRLDAIPEADRKAFASYYQLKGTRVKAVSYDDSNVHLSFNNGLRLSLAVENFEQSDFVHDDRPVRKGRS